MWPDRYVEGSQLTFRSLYLLHFVSGRQHTNRICSYACAPLCRDRGLRTLVDLWSCIHDCTGYNDWKGLSVSSSALHNPACHDVSKRYTVLKRSITICRYLGEWFEAPSSTTQVASYSEQKSAAISNCWVVAAVYFALALVCGLGMVYHRLRRNI